MTHQLGDALVSVTIPWKVHAKQRPRSGKGHTYTPKPTKDAEKLIRDNFEEAVGQGFEPLEGPLNVMVELANEELTIAIWAAEPHTQNKLRGDIDNYMKTVFDALNEVAYVDDKQIVKMTGVKL